MMFLKRVDNGWLVENFMYGKAVMFTKFAVAATLALVAVVPANAVTVITLYNTGVDASGVATTGNSADLHWTLVEGTAFTGASNGVFPIGPWISESSTSRWVTPTSTAADTTDANDHLYTFSETFSLAGYDAATASFAGRFAVDNSVGTIMLNGIALAASGGGFDSWTSFNSTGASFVAGVNTLTFVVRNFGDGGSPSNPAGLLVEVAGTADVSTVPDASVWALMIAGFSMVGFAMRRRSTMVTA